MSSGSGQYSQVHEQELGRHDGAMRYRRLRAPQEDHAALIEPSLDQAGTIADENARLAAGYRQDFLGRSFAELKRQAQTELIAAAREYTASYADLSEETAIQVGERPIFLAGHQPHLFHPGVWAKNFALDVLAKQHGAVAVNLLIDSDTAKNVDVAIPTGSAREPHVELVPLDRRGPVVPFEERSIINRETFGQFGAQATELLRPLVADPLIEKYWPMVMSQTDSAGNNLGESLARARHRLEVEWGMRTLEMPQSRICECASFLWFTAYLLSELPRFYQMHNEALAEYRRVHRIRSSAQPVPDLVVDGPWIETPLWIWTSESPERRPLFVRQSEGRVFLSDRRSLELEIPQVTEGNATETVERLRQFVAQGIKIRSRALVTTLWARLMLGDLFIHGIGGAKYDQVTDAIIQRFFGCRPPGFLVVSATLHLPVDRPKVDLDAARAISRELRELTYHPERYLADSVGGDVGASLPPANRARIQELVAVKSHWIHTPQTRENARLRCRTIRGVNESLQPWVAARRDQLLERQPKVAGAIRAERILASREYAFCLHPERSVRSLMNRLFPSG